MKTLICIGGMPFAKPTLVLGQRLAKVLNSRETTLLTVVKNGGEVENAELMLQEAQRVLATPSVTVQVREGRRGKQILKQLRKSDYGLVVIGAQSAQQLITDWVMRPLPRRVAEQAAVSVLIVAEKHIDIKRILICTAGQAVSEDVVQLGARLTKSFHAEADLLHVAAPVPSMYTGLNTMEENLESLLATDTPLARHLHWGAQLLAEQNTPATLSLRHGLVADEIVRDAERCGADLIVLGGHGEGSVFQDVLMSNVAAGVIAKAPCSVLVVRP